ncbi:MAG: hypothetical protein IJ191_09045 [Treponema sp.]|nr:hypothetical protein [Treponema sp.]
MKRILFSIAFFAAFGQSVISAQLMPQEAAFKDADVAIQFYDRTMYYPGAVHDNPIYIHISIKNNGTDTLRFKLADDRMFSLDFSVYTVRNTQLPQTDTLIRKRTTNQTVYFREIAVEPGEEYAFVENLKEYIAITEQSVYYVELNFYPELYKAKYTTLASNRLTLQVSPSPSAAAVSAIPVRADTAEILLAEELPPDKVVEQTIIARQRSLWNQYFLYMDVEAMLEKNDAARRRYRAASADERARMLTRYRADLMALRIDTDIVAVPERFEIARTTYSPTEGTVEVVEWFRYPTYRERKIYTYYVRQRDGIWMIYDYKVVNAGTE